MSQPIRKETAIILLTVLGALSTMGVSYALRHIAALQKLAIAGESHFVGFIVYGLAISLVASAATAMRARDTIILILAGAIAWIVFVEARDILGMVRFLLFTSAATATVLLARGRLTRSPAWRRLAFGALVPAVVCAIAGLAYHGLAAGLSRGQGGAGAPDLAREIAAGTLWGFSLGLAVGVGLALGGEVVRWMSREGS
ncbi:MAG: hypothetical protein WAW06_04400 [bacterium]